MSILKEIPPAVIVLVVVIILVLVFFSISLTDLISKQQKYIKSPVLLTVLEEEVNIEMTEIAGKYVYDLQMLGALYIQTNQNVKALNTIDRSLKLDPNHLSTLLNRAKVLFALGYKTQGLRQVQSLTTCSDKDIASEAEALFLTHK